MRLDELLVERGLARDLHDAQAYVMAGEVVVGEHRATSAGMSVKSDVAVRLKNDKRRGGFVSRGGLKLQQALDAFALDVRGLSCADLGASSGGFTDCLLQRGAAHVSAVDVGVGQFDWSLRNDPRVSLFERTNIRNVSAADIGGPFDLVVADLSFISLASVMGDIAAFLKPRGCFVSLIKPQFEASKEDVGEGASCTTPRHTLAASRRFSRARMPANSRSAVSRIHPSRAPRVISSFSFGRNPGHAIPRERVVCASMKSSVSSQRRMPS